MIYKLRGRKGPVKLEFKYALLRHLNLCGFGRCLHIPIFQSMQIYEKEFVRTCVVEKWFLWFAKAKDTRLDFIARMILKRFCVRT